MRKFISGLSMALTMFTVIPLPCRWDDNARGMQLALLPGGGRHNRRVVGLRRVDNKLGQYAQPAGRGPAGCNTKCNVRMHTSRWPNGYIGRDFFVENA